MLCSVRFSAGEILILLAGGGTSSIGRISLRLATAMVAANALPIGCATREDRTAFLAFVLPGAQKLLSAHAPECLARSSGWCLEPGGRGWDHSVLVADSVGDAVMEMELHQLDPRCSPQGSQLLSLCLPGNFTRNAEPPQPNQIIAGLRMQSLHEMMLIAVSCVQLVPLSRPSILRHHKTSLGFHPVPLDYD